MQLEKNKTVLVTGGAGFIGSHLVDELGDLEIVVLDDFSTGTRENLAHLIDRENIRIVDGDIRDPETVKSCLEDCQVVFHLACRGVRHSIGHPVESHDVNAGGTLNLLQEARAAGVKRFIHISTSEVYGTARMAPMDENHTCFPETVYGAAKLAGEAYARAYCRTYGFPTVVVRPFNNFGPRSHFEGDSGEVIPRFCVWALNKQRPIIFGDGTQTRDFIFVRETAYWLRRITTIDGLVGDTINLGSGSETSVRKLAEIVYRLAGVPELEPDLQAPRPGDVHRLLANASRAKEFLDFSARVTLEDGISQLLDHLRGQSSDPTELLGMVQARNWVDS